MLCVFTVVLYFGMGVCSPFSLLLFMLSRTMNVLSSITRTICGHSDLTRSVVFTRSYNVYSILDHGLKHTGSDTVWVIRW